MIAGIALAGAIVIDALYSLATLASFFAARLTTAYLSGQSSGLFDHSFTTFLIPTYLLWSFLQAIAVAIAVMLVHTYYGYNAKGSPVGVGVATGGPVRTSLLVVVVITLVISRRLRRVRQVHPVRPADIPKNEGRISP